MGAKLKEKEGIFLEKVKDKLGSEWLWLIGVIAGAVIILAKRQFIDLISVLIAGLTLSLLIRFKKLPEPLVIVAAALIGLLLKIING